jgi:CheY-like chemotaxis protein
MARTLLVEDSPEVRGLLRETLTAEGHEVTVAADGPAPDGHAEIPGQKGGGPFSPQGPGGIGGGGSE